MGQLVCSSSKNEIAEKRYSMRWRSETKRFYIYRKNEKEEEIGSHKKHVMASEWEGGVALIVSAFIFWVRPISWREFDPPSSLPSF